MQRRYPGIRWYVTGIRPQRDSPPDLHWGLYCRIPCRGGRTNFRRALGMSLIGIRRFCRGSAAVANIKPDQPLPHLMTCPRQITTPSCKPAGAEFIIFESDLGNYHTALGFIRSFGSNALPKSVLTWSSSQWILVEIPCTKRAWFVTHHGSESSIGGPGTFTQTEASPVYLASP